MHRVFGYRGVTLFPWTAKVYDRDVRKKEKATSQQKLSDEHNEFKMNGVTPNLQTYYQVLIDQRDCSFVVSLNVFILLIAYLIVVCLLFTQKYK